MKQYIMEFLGTFFFILTVAMTANPWAIASMLMAWVTIGGYVSGGHYNPAVSLAAARRGKIEWSELPGYMTAQVLGGFAAYLFAWYILVSKVSVAHPSVDITKAFIVEVLLAFTFAFVVLAAATAKKFKTSTVFAFAIGFTIPALAAVGGPISGGLFNPAIALGSHLVSAIQGSSISWINLAMYVGGALLGGFLAALAFDYFELD